MCEIKDGVFQHFITASSFGTGRRKNFSDSKIFVRHSQNSSGPSVQKRERFIYTIENK